MKKIKFEYKKEFGFITYDETVKKCDVVFSGKNPKEVIKKVVKYLNTKRTYQMGDKNPDIIDGGTIEKHYPFESDFFFMASLNSLIALDIKILWKESTFD